MAEPWAFPDKPYAGTVKKSSSKQERTGCAALHLIQSTTCLRQFFALYLDDQSSQATTFIAPWCCDRHNNTSFDLSTYFLGSQYTGISALEDLATDPSKKRPRNRYQAMDEHWPLLKKLREWRTSAHGRDPQRSVQPITWLCDDDALNALSKAHPDNLRSQDNIIKLLDKTEEWGSDCGAAIFAIISKFNSGTMTSSSSRPAKRSKASSSSAISIQ
ncbi:hypothetical protein PAXINDRAFT_14523 [Paxillus involutus ATCC 200175]|uniref:Uncharacterized protein n=1 Tax=Paxillus involutus ATCC 200175 TaxID=664439 RepID=A0A0C9TZ84_PAXIN|nr:hypothetical protein PAXINDRAFT_14523 [Paxillus involutus ATCC 200175]